MDRYSLDVIHEALLGIYIQLQTPKYCPLLLKRVVSAGLLGVKTKRDGIATRSPLIFIPS